MIMSSIGLSRGRFDFGGSHIERSEARIEQGVEKRRFELTADLRRLTQTNEEERQSCGSGLSILVFDPMVTEDGPFNFINLFKLHLLPSAYRLRPS